MRTRLPIAFAFVERLVNAQSIAEVQEVNRSPLEQRKVELQRELLERFEVTPMLKLGMRLEEFVELMEQSASAGKLDPRIRPIRDPRVTVDC